MYETEHVPSYRTGAGRMRVREATVSASYEQMMHFAHLLRVRVTVGMSQVGADQSELPDDPVDDRELVRYPASETLILADLLRDIYGTVAGESLDDPTETDEFTYHYEAGDQDVWVPELHSVIEAIDEPDDVPESLQYDLEPESAWNWTGVVLARAVWAATEGDYTAADIAELRF